MKVKYHNLIVIVAALATLTSCRLSATPEQVKESFDVQPGTFDECMSAGSKAMQNNDPDKAVALFRQATKIAEDVYGPDDLRVANAAEPAADILKGQAKLSEAEVLYQKAYGVLKKSEKPGSSDLERVEKSYADVLVKNFKLDQAKKVYPQLRLPDVPPESVRVKHSS